MVGGPPGHGHRPALPQHQRQPHPVHRRPGRGNLAADAQAVAMPGIIPGRHAPPRLEAQSPLWHVVEQGQRTEGGELRRLGPRAAEYSHRRVDRDAVLAGRQNAGDGRRSPGRGPRLGRGDQKVSGKGTPAHGCGRAGPRWSEVGEMAQRRCLSSIQRRCSCRHESLAGVRWLHAAPR